MRTKLININSYCGYILAALLFAFTSCDKSEGDVLEGKGSNFFKVTATDQFVIAGFNAAPGKGNLIEIRRDVISEAELSLPSKVSFQVDNSIVTQHNADHPDDQYEILGDALYSFDGQDIQFAAGDFVKNLEMNLDPSTLDFSKKYALGIVLKDPDGTYKIRSGSDKVLVWVVVKNEYDGQYSATGIFHHPTAGDRPINEIKDLSTVGAKTVLCNLGDLGGAGYQMTLTVNADNSVTVAPAGATPNIDQSWGENFYDPATRTFHLHYSYNTAAPRIVEESIKRN